MVEPTCPPNMIIYMLPMMLGRTFDIQNNTPGVDIFSEAQLRRAREAQTSHYTVESDYTMISKLSDKRDLLGISGDLALKVSSGMVDVKGSGEYLKDTSNSNNSIEVLIRLKYKSVLQKIEDNVRPDPEKIDWFTRLPKELVGTHVVTEVLFGAEVFASVKFIARKDDYLQEIKGSVDVAFGKQGTFDVKAAGKLEDIAKNMSSMARTDIVYFANAPLKTLPKDLEGLKNLVADFGAQIQGFNKGDGVAICVELTPLSKYTTNRDFQFTRNQELQTRLDDFNHKFDNLREAKTSLKEFVATLPDNYKFKDELIQFSNDLNKVLGEFYKAIGNLDIQSGSKQLNDAVTAFSHTLNERDYGNNNRFTAKLSKLKSSLAPKEDTTSPRGVFVRWGKRGCGPKTGSVLYNGTIASFPERGVGAGTLYQCMPEDPQMNTRLRTIKGAEGRESSLTAIRYQNLSLYPNKGKDLEGHVASCSVCLSLLRPTVRMFAAADKCPGDGDWTEEYKGYLASTLKSSSKTEFVCLDYEAEVFEKEKSVSEFQSYILPTRVGNHGLPNSPTWNPNQSVHCVVCSK